MSPLCRDICRTALQGSVELPSHRATAAVLSGFIMTPNERHASATVMLEPVAATGPADGRAAADVLRHVRAAAAVDIVVVLLADAVTGRLAPVAADRRGTGLLTVAPRTPADPGWHPSAPAGGNGGQANGSLDGVDLTRVS